MKTQVSIYGAGSYAEQYLLKLINFFEIIYVFDSAEEKQGNQIYNIDILKPDQKNVNEYPVIVLLNNVKSGYESLKRLDCHQRIYGFAAYAGGYGIFPYGEDLPITTLLEKGYWLRDPDTDFSAIKSQENAIPYISGKTRYFNIASPTDFDATGGPCACLRNLWLANEEFGLIDNFYTLCPTVAYIPKGAPITNKEDCRQLQTLTNKACVLQIEPINSSLKDGDRDEVIRLYMMLQALANFLNKADLKFQFHEKDVFLLQDPYILEVFIGCFPDFQNVIAAYHVQGTLQSELSKRIPKLGNIFDTMQLKHLQKIKDWIFPSKGAADGFLETGTKLMVQAAEKCRFHIAYNGYEPKKNIQADTDFLKQMNGIKNADIIFASATFLYYNKGVELIPGVLAKFKQQTGLKIYWVLVGSGEMELEVEKNLQQYLQEDEYTWYRKRFDNQDNIFALFSKADFYIMMHRVSVFDLSTLQAMAYECVPFLSDIGGNRELCGFENGILINPLTEHLNLEGYFDGQTWKTEYLQQQKIRNREIVREKFNNKAFLEGYRDVLYQ